VIDAIRSAISSGALPEGEKLPPVRALSWDLGVTPGTVARAYRTLTEEGALRGEIGRGTFVAERHSPSRAETPIEVDVVPHSCDPESYAVSMFSPHLPSVGQSELIRRLLGQVAQDPPSGMMQYPNRTAARPAREAVVHWLSGTPLGPVSEADIILSQGGQNGLMLTLQAILRGGAPTVLIEELSYPGFRRAAELLRANVVPVAMDEHGVIPEALEAAAAAHGAQVFCTSPEVHNPTGLFTPLERREALVEVARRHDLDIVEDDCYRMQVDRAPTYRMLAPERGWYVSSIAKTLTPALRIGFAIAPQERTADLRRVAEHNCFGLATPLIDLTASLLTHPEVDGLTEELHGVLNRYIEAVVNALGGYDVTWRRSVPFLWLRLPIGWRANAFCQAAASEGVQIRPAEEFVCRDARAPHAVRLAINAGVGLKSFEAAVGRLRRLLDNPPDQIPV
jgi:DNA-binding transcriptional MocR family regulator